MMVALRPFLADQQPVANALAKLAGFYSLSNLNGAPLRRNAIGHHFQITLAGFHVGRYVHGSSHGTRVAYSHGAVAMGAAVENMAGGSVSKAHNRIVGCVL
jgi:hypothetical protein